MSATRTSYTWHTQTRPPNYGPGVGIGAGDGASEASNDPISSAKSTSWPRGLGLARRSFRPVKAQLAATCSDDRYRRATAITPWPRTPRGVEKRQFWRAAGTTRHRPTCPCGMTLPKCFVVMGFGTKSDFAQGKTFDLVSAYERGETLQSSCTGTLLNGTSLALHDQSSV
jgi:hypothetical protein